MPTLTIIQPDAGETIPLGGGTTRFLVRSAASDDAVVAVENTIAAGFPGPPQHLHHAMSHLWYILEGELTITSGSDETVVGAGGMVYVPAGTPHTFANPSGRPARLLEINLPGNQFDRYYDDLYAAFPPGTPPEPGKIAAIQQRYDTHPPA